MQAREVQESSGCCGFLNFPCYSPAAAAPHNCRPACLVTQGDVDRRLSRKFSDQLVLVRNKKVPGLYPTASHSRPACLVIKNKKVYVSYEMKKYESCFTNSVLEADLNLQNLVFNEFFTINECQPKYLNQVGGYLSNYTKDKIFMTDIFSMVWILKMSIFLK